MATLQELAETVTRIGRVSLRNESALRETISRRIMKSDENAPEESRRLRLLDDALAACRDYAIAAEFAHNSPGPEAQERTNE